MRLAALALRVLLWALPGLVPAEGQAAAAGSPFPLRVDGARLLDAQGGEFRIVGDAPWTLLVALTLPEADDYLAARQAEGFNGILVELVEPHFTGPRNRNGDEPFAGGDFSRPVDAYFRHATAVLDLALKRGFVVLLTPAYVGYQCGDQGYCQRMLGTPDPVLEGYGRYLGRLLSAYPNIVWVHGGDVDARRYQAMAKVEAVYRGIETVLPGAIHTAHCARNLSALDCYARPWLDLNTTYSDCAQTPARVRLDRDRARGMPSLYIEGRYEEEKSSALCLRSQLWWSYLGGSVGHVFGNKRIWRFESDWRAALDTPGARAMGIAGRLLARTPAVLAISLGESPIAVDRPATAWSRLRERDYAARLAWSGVVDAELEIPVAQSATTTIAYLPYLTHFTYSRTDETLCWVDPRTGGVVVAGDDPGDLRSPDGGDWLFIAEKVTGICSLAGL